MLSILCWAIAQRCTRCIAQVRQEPPDLYAQLRAATFARYAVLGHAKIGFHHVFKIRYFGATTVTLHHRLGRCGGAVARAGERTRLRRQPCKNFYKRSAGS